MLFKMWIKVCTLTLMPWVGLIKSRMSPQTQFKVKCNRIMQRTACLCWLHFDQFRFVIVKRCEYYHGKLSTKNGQHNSEWKLYKCRCNFAKTLPRNCSLRCTCWGQRAERPWTHHPPALTVPVHDLKLFPQPPGEGRRMRKIEKKRIKDLIGFYWCTELQRGYNPKLLVPSPGYSTLLLNALLWPIMLLINLVQCLGS